VVEQPITCIDVLGVSVIAALFAPAIRL